MKAYWDKAFAVYRPPIRMYFIDSSSRWWSIAHGVRRDICTIHRASVPPYKLFTITNLPLILHNHATAAAERFHAVGAEAAFEMIELPYPGSVDCCKYPWYTVSHEFKKER